MSQSQSEYVSWPTKAVRTLLSSSQLKAMHATPITLVAAPGAGKVIIPLLCTMQYKFGTAPYTSSSHIAVQWGENNDPAFTAISGGEVLAQTDDWFVIAPTLLVDDLLSVFENTPLVILNDGAEWTGGDGTLTVNLYYVVTPLA